MYSGPASDIIDMCDDTGHQNQNGVREVSKLEFNQTETILSAK